MHTNRFFDGTYDAVVNYILLKGKSLKENREYLNALLQFCEQHKVKRLVHISSISAFEQGAHSINENTPLEPDPTKKGSYGALKADADKYLTANAPSDLTISFVRPGFILGRGLANPIVGTALQLPWDKLLCVGESRAQMPVITRDLVNTAVRRCLERPIIDSRESFLLVHNESPTRYEFLQACCKELGAGRGVMTSPSLLWRMLGVGAEAAARLIGKSELKPYQKISNRCSALRFDSSVTEGKLDLNLSFDWRKTLRTSLPNQGKPTNSYVPYAEPDQEEDVTQPVAFIGYGRIVKQRHLPALRKLNHTQPVHAYDLYEGIDEGQAVQKADVANLPEKAIYVVATPGPVHNEAVSLLRNATGPILIEKPLCYSVNEMDQWISLAQSRVEPIWVCHNYRFKNNVLQLKNYMNEYNSGELHHVNVVFQSPPVRQDGAAWMRKERMTRTLLMDYALHFLDIACMFSNESWEVSHVRHTLNASRETDLIKGVAQNDDYSVSFSLRQGFIPRKAEIEYTFQNYTATLSFFPDTFSVQMGAQSYWHHFQRMKADVSGTANKVMEKVGWADAASSHSHVYQALLNRSVGASRELPNAISVTSLSPFYKLLFDLSASVYPQRS